MIWRLIDNRGSDDPAVNLALEEYLLRSARFDDHYMLIYRNRPAVIIGKHQNVAEEVNLKYCRENKILVYRRLSGGGAVYHDSGNINFSFITRRSLNKVNNYAYFIAPMLRLIAKLGADAQTDVRSNIIINGVKVSGNAQFTARTRMLSHGTLLYKATLPALRRSLQVNSKVKIESKSSKSVRSPVGNLSEILPKAISVSDFISKTVEAYQAVPFTLGEKDWRDIEDMAERRYRSVEWNYNRSPACKIFCPLHPESVEVQIILSLENGYIVTVEFTGIEKQAGEAAEARRLLTGMHFDYDSLMDKRTVWLAEQGWPDILFNIEEK